MAFSGALLLLTKQNTAIGTLIGLSALLLAAPAAQPPGRRWRRALLALTLTLACFCLLAAAILPWASLAGLVQDVFLHGSEPKGGYDTGPEAASGVLFIFGRRLPGLLDWDLGCTTTGEIF